MQEDEERHDEAVPADRALPDLLVQLRVGVALVEPPVAEDEAAQQQVDDAYQYRGGEDIGGEAVDAAHHAEIEVLLPGCRHESLERVEHVDEQVVDEAVEDEGVEEAHPGPCPEDGHLAYRAQRRVPDAPRQLVQARVDRVTLAGRYRQGHSLEALVGECERRHNQEQEQDLFDWRKHADRRAERAQPGIVESSVQCNGTRATIVVYGRCAVSYSGGKRKV